MAGRRKINRIVLLGLLGSCLALVPCWPALQLQAVPDRPAAPGGRGAASAGTVLLPLWQGSHFTLEYRHSVNKTPVWEEFVALPGRGLLLTGTAFQSYGVGTPFEPGEGRLVLREGYFELTGLHRQMPGLDLRVVPLNHYHLRYAGQDYPLSSYFAPGALVRITAVRRSLPGLLGFWWRGP
ncbi:MAG: DUF1850 domain-containing protein [Desulfurispora sp.]|uniref:DUF1850 domain-containing protein n=1 Tax=Desulfurispora sp. TaxID=3014275 RepID=UPI00404B60BD